MFPLRAWSRRPLRALAIALLLTLALGQFIANVTAANAPVYPDLVPLQAAHLYFEKTPDGHYLLRFDSSTANYGGPLEISVKSLQDKQIYQNLYDKIYGGKIVLRTKIGADLIFHPTHNHFHFQDFGQYALVKRDKAGVYRDTTKVGEKTSFCILDLMRVASGGPPSRAYGGCGATIQGLSSGWADTYVGSLSGQWIDVGGRMLADGDYAIRTTSDPDNKILEAKDFNNVSMTYFAVRNGRLDVAGGLPPLCTVQTGVSSAAGPATTVGTMVDLSCNGFGAGESVNLYWGSTNTAPRATVPAGVNGVVSTTFLIPPADLGVHYILARGNTSGTQAAAVVNVIPSIVLTPGSGAVERTITATLRGFSSGEQVDVGYYKTATQRIALGTVTTSSSGSATVNLALPASVFGQHTIDARGLASGQTGTTTYLATPSLVLVPGSVQAGSVISLSGRGFGANEMIRISLVSPQSALGAVQASSTGSTRISEARVTIPATLAPGTYQVLAEGLTSGGSIQTSLTVLAHDASEDPTPTATATATAPNATATPAPAETATAPPEATATATATVTVTSAPTETATAPPTDTPTATETATETATAIPTDTATELPTASATPTATATSDSGLSPPGP